MGLLTAGDIDGEELEAPTPIKDDMYFFEHIAKVIGQNAVRAGMHAMHVGEPGHIEMLGFAINTLRNLPLKSTNARSILMDEEHEKERIKALSNLLDTQFTLLTNNQVWWIDQETLLNKKYTQPPYSIYRHLQHEKLTSRPTICYSVDIGAMPTPGGRFQLSDVILKRHIAQKHDNRPFTVHQEGEIRINLTTGVIVFIPVVMEKDVIPLDEEE